MNQAELLLILLIIVIIYLTLSFIIYKKFFKKKHNNNLPGASITIDTGNESNSLFGIIALLLLFLIVISTIFLTYMRYKITFASMKYGQKEIGIASLSPEIGQGLNLIL